MPELPEVETMRRGILSAVGSRIVRVERIRCWFRPILTTPRMTAFRRRTAQSTITAVERQGKRVLICLDTCETIVVEPRMTGLLVISAAPDREHLRFQWHLEGPGPKQLLYWDRRGLGSVRLVSGTELESLFGKDRLGPDALDITADALRFGLHQSRRAIKVALLDQRRIAGIGNLYASEILHHARIHPERPCCSLQRKDWNALHTAIGHTLREAIRYEGSTLGDGTYRNALNQIGQYQNHHRVYNRAGEPCPRCQVATVERRVQAQRSTFFCPKCQRGSV